MAILSKFEATVSVDGNKLTEFDAGEDDLENAEEKTIVKYIESTPGAEFSLDFAVKPKYNPKCGYLAWVLYIDGQYAIGVVMSKDEFQKGKHTEPVHAKRDGLTCKVNGEWQNRKFKFSNISFEQQSAQNDQKRTDGVSQIGTLKVELWRRRLKKVTKRTEEDTFDPTGGISEKSTKGQAVSHTVGLASGEKISRPGNVYSGTNVDNKPIATFVFKYRSKKDLQDLMILPRSPSPPPPLEERPLDDLSMKEMRELIQRQRAEAAMKTENMSNLKREREESNILANSPLHSKRFCGAGSSLARGIDEGVEYTSSRPVRGGPSEVIVLDD